MDAKDTCLSCKYFIKNICSIINEAVNVTIKCGKYTISKKYK